MRAQRGRVPSWTLLVPCPPVSCALGLGHLQPCHPAEDSQRDVSERQSTRIPVLTQTGPPESFSLLNETDKHNLEEEDILFVSQPPCHQCENYRGT